MRIVWAFLIIVLALPCDAKWANISTEELVEKSDLIVIGTLDNVRHWSDNGIDYGQGDIKIEQVLWGDPGQHAELRLVWQNESNVMCPRLEHGNWAKKKGIWMLTRGKKGTFLANYPGRYVPLDQEDEIVRLTGKKRQKNKQ